MADKDPVKVTLDEDEAIVARLDDLAKREGTSRSALIRRAIRQMLFSSPTVPSFGKLPEMETIEPAPSN